MSETTPLEELLEAFTIFVKYDEGEYPTNCSHDELAVLIDPEKVSESDAFRLGELGFFISKEYDGFASYKYGSC